ncbi:MAG: ATP synthase F0 subunit B [Candidatus Eremiobacteraeota bacterium]|nr:ATP synthase F0 subunit B [Candidatus Eremiobacteraeota bacterium]
MFLKLDGTFWVQIINFFIFYAILNVVYIKPAAQALRKRREYIDSVQNEYDAARRSQRELVVQADQKRAEGRREGDHRAAALRSEAMRQAEEIVGKAQAEGLQISQDALNKVERELNAARASRYRLVRELAADMYDRAVRTL